MSYSIIYDKQFVKLEKSVTGKEEDIFMPLTISGDNNVYDWLGNGRKRSRNWYNYDFPTNYRTMASLEDMLRKAKESYEESCKSYDQKDDGSNFGSVMGITDKNHAWDNYSLNNHLSYFRTGCKKSLTVEELAVFGVSLEAITSPYVRDETLKENGIQRFSKVIESSAELFTLIKELTKDGASKVSVNWSLSISEESLPILRKQAFPSTPKTKKSKTIDKVFVIKYENGFYAKGNRNIYRTHFESAAKQYYLPGTAQAKANKLASILPSFNFKVVPFALKTPITIMI
jgi:hypothetical protein